MSAMCSQPCAVVFGSVLGLVRTCCVYVRMYVNAVSVSVWISRVSLTPAHRDEKVRSLQAELEEQQERLVNGEQLPIVICR